MVRNCDITPKVRPTSNSSLECALKYNLEEATIPISKINILIEKEMLI